MDFGTTPRDIYLIAVRNFVVLQDLSDTVREFDPSACLLTAGDCCSALSTLRCHDRITLAFIEGGPTRIAHLSLDAEIRARGGRLILLGDEAEDAWDSAGGKAPRWPTLLRPFSAQAVQSLIVALRA